MKNFQPLQNKSFTLSSLCINQSQMISINQDLFSFLIGKLHKHLLSSFSLLIIKKKKKRKGEEVPFELEFIGNQVEIPIAKEMHNQI